MIEDCDPARLEILLKSQDDPAAPNTSLDCQEPSTYIFNKLFPVSHHRLPVIGSDGLTFDTVAFEALVKLLPS